MQKPANEYIQKAISQIDKLFIRDVFTGWWMLLVVVPTYQWLVHDAAVKIDAYYWVYLAYASVVLSGLALLSAYLMQDRARILVYIGLPIALVPMPASFLMFWPHLSVAYTVFTLAMVAAICGVVVFLFTSDRTGYYIANASLFLPVVFYFLAEPLTGDRFFMFLTAVATISLYPFVYEVNVRNRRENLAVRIEMDETVKSIRKNAERLDYELGYALEVQQSIIPRTPRTPNLPGLTAQLTRKARNISRCFNDTVPVGDRYYFCFGVVAGKHARSALVTIYIKNLFASMCTQAPAPADLLAAMQGRLAKQLDYGLAVSLAVGYFESDYSLQYAATKGILGWNISENKVVGLEVSDVALDGSDWESFQVSGNPEYHTFVFLAGATDEQVAGLIIELDTDAGTVHAKIAGQLDFERSDIAVLSFGVSVPEELQANV